MAEPFVAVERRPDGVALVRLDLDVALEWAAALARGPLVAHGLAKAVIDGGLEGTLAEGLAAEQEAFAAVARTEDAERGIASFAEHGPGRATFVGR